MLWLCIFRCCLNWQGAETRPPCPSQSHLPGAYPCHQSRTLWSAPITSYWYQESILLRLKKQRRTSTVPTQTLSRPLICRKSQGSVPTNNPSSKAHRGWLSLFLPRQNDRGDSTWTESEVHASLFKKTISNPCVMKLWFDSVFKFMVILYLWLSGYAMSMSYCYHGARIMNTP